MITDVDIVNAALIRLGERTIASLSDAVKPAQLAGALFAETRDALLREHPWNFAVRRMELSVPATRAAFEGPTAGYVLPDGAGGAARCLRLLAVEDSGGRYLDHKVDGRIAQAPLMTRPENLLASPEDMTATAWGVTAGSIAGAQSAAPFGFGLADEVSDSSAVARAYIGQVVTGISDRAVYASSVLVRPGTLPATDATLELRFTGGSGELTGCYAEIDFATGALAFRDPTGTVRGYERENLGGGWYRLSLAVANNASGNTSAEIRVYTDGLANGDPASQLSLFVAAPRLFRVTPLSVVMVAGVTDPEFMEPLFRDALAARLAMELAEPLGKSTTLQRAMAEIYIDKLRAARSSDGQEGTHDAFTADTWLDARA